MSTTLEKIETFKCIHCGSGFRTTMQLKSHINRARNCREKEKLLKSNQNKKIRLDEEQRLPVTFTEDENLIADEVDNQVMPIKIDSQKPFDSGLELAKFVKSCFGGRGLSIKDTDKLIELVKNPQFDGSKLPYNNGKAANLWLNKKLESLSGPSQVFFLCYILLLMFSTILICCYSI